MAYPAKYKPLLNALRSSPPSSLAELTKLFVDVRSEIEANRDRGDVTQTEDLEDIPLEYKMAREIVSKTVTHAGFLEIDDEIYDSVDDCADLLIDLDFIEKLESLQPVPDVWWTYMFSYDSHYGDHMKSLEIQARWLIDTQIQSTQF